ncbi:MAG: hypothetical protein NVS3B16_02740 [Vulcanimicrobiaceae bacterium]
MIRNTALPRDASGVAAMSVPDPAVLGAALAALARSLETRHRLEDLVADFSRSVRGVLGHARIDIYVAGKTAPPQGVAIALRLDGAIVGTLVVRTVAHPLSPGALEALQLLATPLAVAIAHRQRSERRRGTRQSARVDALCRIPNRLAFDERMREMWDLCAARGLPVAVALFDVDFFKAYNEAYGHPGGDRCLRDVAAVLSNRRIGDGRFCARYGGEEFVMLFADATLEQAAAEVQLILYRLAAANIEHAQTTLGRVSASVGIAAAEQPRLASGPAHLVAEADRALFRAKRLGRNRICAGTFVSDGAAVARRVAGQGDPPAPDGPTFGRDDDIARMLAALRHARMLTLVGPAGIGKSRVRALLGAAAPRRLARRVVFVETAILRAGTDPAAALASAFDLPVDTGDSLEAVTNYLDERDALLILDHGDETGDDVRQLCEHLIARTANVSIVAAGRTPLGVAGERSIVVAPLDDDAAVDYLAFLCAGDRSACGRIVPFLGGHPVAIRLAADHIARAGHVPLLQRLLATGTRCASAADFEAFLRADPGASLHSGGGALRVEGVSAAGDGEAPAAAQRLQRPAVEGSHRLDRFENHAAGERTAS